MSFLTQLRQQNSKEPGLSLCYLLDIDCEKQALTLSLSLIDIHQGQHLHTGRGTHTASTPYHIQRQHLQSPPPFFVDEDITLLRFLIDDDDSWSENHCGKLPHQTGPWCLNYILNTQRCFIHSNGNPRRIISGKDQPIFLHWHIDPSGNQHLRWQTPVFTHVFYLKRPYLFNTNALTISEGITHIKQEALDAVVKQNQSIPAHAVPHFLSEHQQQWHQWDLPLPVAVVSKNIEANLTPVLRLTAPQETTNTQNSLQLEFRYCNDTYCGTIAPAIEQNDIKFWNNNTLYCFLRQPDQEQRWAQQLTPFLDHFNSGTQNLSWYSEEPNSWQILLTQSRQALENLGFTFVIEAGFRHHYVTPKHWQVELQTGDNNNWQLAIQLQAGNKTINLLALLHQLQSLTIDDDNNQYCLSMDDGRFLLLPKDKFNGLREELGDLVTQTDGSYQLPCNQLSRLAPLQAFLPKDTEWQGDIDLLEHSINIHQQPELVSESVENDFINLNAQLRPYQRLGAFWLQHLKRHQINGLLADDMGLGKTIQTLAHLCIEQQLGQLQQPALIVVPTSLLHNWSSEIERYAPKLRFIMLHGSHRHQHWEQLDQFDVIITSYSLISNDLIQWQQKPLSWVILDEAQMIKNHRTQISRAIRQLNSRHRLCLSGTPVENHLGELWSIFDFLMPNCLGSYTQFNDFFRTPIEKQGNSQRFEQLLQRIAPFLLRRTKEKVTTDLPPKTQIYQTIIMDDDQRKFYDQLKTQTQLEIQEQSSQGEQGNQHLQVLTALLKLRQACCDPLLLGENDIGSAKKDHCLDMISELVAENRNIILFSQFTSMLDILASELEERGIEYLKLTGASRDRQQLVKDFQAGKAPVFLISLKAGGVGLNLTRADTVIHYDPWWNNAAEQQASDRAHRIGQDKPVFVYKLIVEGSIEEKIAQLQQRKAILSHDISLQAQLSGELFAFKLEDLLSLWDEEECAKAVSIES